MDKIKRKLSELEQEGNLRHLVSILPEGRYLVADGHRYLNMSSNDYLGIAADLSMQRDFMRNLRDSDRFVLSNPSSRLMTGNSLHYDMLEDAISLLYPGKSALVASSGYAVNTGVLRAVTFPSDIIVADKLVHASIIDGIVLSQREWARYRHNDMNHLESLLKKYSGTGRKVWVVTESVFSMDGDRAPLKEICRLKEKYGFCLYLDEAHAFGIFGEGGQGLAQHEGVSDAVDITVATFGKAAASAGGFVVCNSSMRELLINRMRTLIFSTALPPVTLLWSEYVTRQLPHMNDRREKLHKLISVMTSEREGATQIIPIMTGSNASAIALAEKLRDCGYWVNAIRYPTVPRGKARVRLSLSAAMEESEIRQFIKICDNVI